MNLIQRQLKVVSLSSKLESFISEQLNITGIFRYVSLTTVCNYIATCAIEQPEENDELAQCLIALAFCAAQIPADRSPTQNIALYIIKVAAKSYPGLIPLLNKATVQIKPRNMLS
ncbi:hypothetical protein [Shewanella fidelis]|uniref:hypothetical protein n=1 Tax=Shewanella fidelis TaxID=173509 RepID=UPI00048AF49A|nr:hypothetical protein [Shewanella fidelis]